MEIVLEFLVGTAGNVRLVHKKLVLVKKKDAVAVLITFTHFPVNLAGLADHILIIEDDYTDLRT